MLSHSRPEFLSCATDIKLLCDTAGGFINHYGVLSEVVIRAFAVDFRPGVAVAW